MMHYTITGAGGVPLHVVATGRTSGPSILFVHGISQSSLVWSRQLDSKLAEDFRLVALDLRGHGRSGKPPDVYSDTRLWADDIRAVIESLQLDRPVVCGWSYGPLIMLDYIRHHGDAQLGGLQFVSGITKLGSEAALAPLFPAFLNLVPGFFATDAEESVRSLRSLLELFFVAPPSDADAALLLGIAVLTPPYVRQALFSRTLDNDDLLPKITKPVLITHGVADAIVDPKIVHDHRRGIAHAELDLMEHAGHAPFWENPAAFNVRLRQFAMNCRE